MKKQNLLNRLAWIMLISLLLSNYSALAQKTTIWIVRDAEPNVTSGGNSLSEAGKQRAEDLQKALKHQNIKTIYINAGQVAALTAAPMARKAKILPRVYTDSVSAFVSKVLKNFQGMNVLIVAQYENIMPLIEQLGVEAPFSQINDDDFDLLFSITVNDSSDKRELFISHYGKAHHSTVIPQEYILQNFYPDYVPPIMNH